MLILHLSRLVSPRPRPHHSRIARVLLQDTATRFGGQVFALRNQDLVLLARASPIETNRSAAEGENLAVHEPEVLPDTLATLFSADIPPETRLTSLLRLNDGLPTLLGYLTECMIQPSVTKPVAQPHDLVLSLAALHSILDRAPLAELLVLRTGMRLGPGRHLSLAERLIPAFRCVEFSFSALNLSPLVARATSDPFLFRYLAGGLDARLIEVLSDDVAKGGGLTRPAVRAGLPVHVELGLTAVLSPDFAQLARLAANVGLRFGVAMPLMQASADLDRLEEARRVLSIAGSELVITQFQPRQLHYTDPAPLRPSLVKLNWSSSLLGQSLAASGHGVGKLDPARIVLEGVDSQRALVWGQAHGLVLYEGNYLDQLQAAHRMEKCDSASACSLGQCCTRARGAGQWGRTGCQNPELLDACGHGVIGMERAA